MCQPAWSSVADMTCAGYGDPIGSDGAQRQLARLRQAIWRVDTLGIEACQPRARRDGSVVCVGSELPHTDGPAAGRPNFLSDAAFDYATERLADSRDASLGVDHSGAPVAVQHVVQPADVLQPVRRPPGTHPDPRSPRSRGHPGHVLRHPHQHGRRHRRRGGAHAVGGTYLDDKTGWDAAIWINGGTGLITIETKYTDPLDTSAPMTPKKRRVDAANELELFTEDAMVHFRQLGRRRDARIEKANAKRADKGLTPLPLGGGPDFDQMARNLLLTEAYRIRNRLTMAVNYVLAPKFDEQAEPLVRSTVDRLTDKHKSIARYRTLDAVVDAALPALGGLRCRARAERVPIPLPGPVPCRASLGWLAGDPPGRAPCSGGVTSRFPEELGQQRRQPRPWPGRHRRRCWPGD